MSKAPASGIDLGTKASSVINSIKKNDANATVVIKNSSGKTIENDFVGTGSTIEIKDGDKSIKLTVVIYGDASGDGKINVLDLVKVQKHILGINKLSGAFEKAGDPSGDGKIVQLNNRRYYEKKYFSFNFFIYVIYNS